MLIQTLFLVFGVIVDPRWIYPAKSKSHVGDQAIIEIPFVLLRCHYQRVVRPSQSHRNLLSKKEKDICRNP